MDLNFNNMDDEQFRKEFMRFLTMYQSSIQNLMNRNKSNDYFINPFGMDEDMIKKIFNNIQDDLNIEKGEDEDGEWEKRNFSSPDGKSNFSSFSRSGFYNPFDGSVSFKNQQKEMDTLQLLDMKMRNAIMDEKYEDAAKIRDLIKSLKEDENKNPQ
tara:strand:- start:12331 stop:12798 length:468 start_codon:yes stop_codon:yes gene_type:complete